jgi:hypothetical protein
MATKNIEETSLKLLPYLIYYAQQRELKTYGELAKVISRHHRILNHCLGYIRDEICRPKNIPLLNAIVVNASTGMPGESFLPEGAANLTPDEYQKEFEKHRDKVFLYEGWDKLLAELGLEPIPREDNDFDQEAFEYIKTLQRLSVNQKLNSNADGKQQGVAESENHKKLKKYIFECPDVIGIHDSKHKQDEFLFPSGDICDIIFQVAEDKYAVVEVKNGQRGELVKGIYQAIKYQSLGIAYWGRGKAIKVNAVLAAYQIPSDIRRYASKFGVSCFEITPPDTDER